MRRLFWFAALVLAACEPVPPPSMVIHVTPEHEALVQAFAAPLPMEGVQVRAADDPAERLGAHQGLPEIALVVDPAACAGCYRAERTATGVIVRGDAPLGIQRRSRRAWSRRSA